MTKLRRTALALAMTLSASSAQASMWGEENAQLAELVALSVEEIYQLSVVINNIKTTIRGINEVASGVREAFRIYTVLRDYDVNDLVYDARRGLERAFPEIVKLQSEVGELIENGETIQRGNFWTHVGPHERRMHRLLDRAFRYGYRNSIWPVVFPNGARTRDPSPVDTLIQQRLHRSGLLLRVAWQDTALGVLSKKTETLVRDAEEKERGDLQAQAINAQVNTQNLNNTTRLRDLTELEAARQEAQETTLQAVESKVTESLQANTQELLRFGVVR
jgi:hypothetical protein